MAAIADVVEQSPRESVKFLSLVLKFGVACSVLSTPLIISAIRDSYHSGYDPAPASVLHFRWLLCAILTLQTLQLPLRVVMLRTLHLLSRVHHRDQLVTHLAHLVTSKAWAANQRSGYCLYATFLVSVFLSWLHGTDVVAPESMKVVVLCWALCVVVRFVVAFAAFFYYFMYMDDIPGLPNPRGATDEMKSRIVRFKWSASEAGPEAGTKAGAGAGAGAGARECGGEPAPPSPIKAPAEQLEPQLRTHTISSALPPMPSAAHTRRVRLGLRKGSLSGLDLQSLRRLTVPPSPLASPLPSPCVSTHTTPVSSPCTSPKSSPRRLGGLVSAPSSPRGRQRSLFDLNNGLRQRRRRARMLRRAGPELLAAAAAAVAAAREQNPMSPRWVKATHTTSTAAEVEHDDASDCASDASDNTDMCPICLCDFEPGDDMAQLPCHASHVFHYQCVTLWFQQATSCPLCAGDLGEMSDDDDEDHALAALDGLGPQIVRTR